MDILLAIFCKKIWHFCPKLRKLIGQRIEADFVLILNFEIFDKKCILLKRGTQTIHMALGDKEGAKNFMQEGAIFSNQGWVATNMLCWTVWWWGSG